MKEKEESYNWWGLIFVGLLIYGGYNLFWGDKKESDSVYQPSSSYNYNTANVIGSYDYSSNEEDGYSWAEENDISSFDECQDQFGTGYEEDECNRYVKENYTGYSSFNGYDCTEDCSGHEAGYNWAEENDIDDEYDCDGNSNSFNEGCTAYVEDNY